MQGLLSSLCFCKGCFPLTVHKKLQKWLHTTMPCMVPARGCYPSPRCLQQCPRRPRHYLLKERDTLGSGVGVGGGDAANTTEGGAGTARPLSLFL